MAAWPGPLRGAALLTERGAPCVADGLGAPGVGLDVTAVPQLAVVRPGLRLRDVPGLGPVAPGRRGDIDPGRAPHGGGPSGTILARTPRAHGYCTPAPGSPHEAHAAVA